MELLSEDTKVVDALKRILENADYDYLAYNESKSKGNDFLQVDVIADKPDNANMHRSCIEGELKHVIGRSFSAKYDAGARDSRRGDLDKQWGYFRIRERIPFKLKKTPIGRCFSGGQDKGRDVKWQYLSCVLSH